MGVLKDRLLECGRGLQPVGAQISRKVHELTGVPKSIRGRLLISINAHHALLSPDAFGGAGGFDRQREGGNGSSEDAAMITFRVVKERHGWAVRKDEHLTIPFWSRSTALREANSLAQAIRQHGVGTEVLIEESDNEAEADRNGFQMTAART